MDLSTLITDDVNIVEVYLCVKPQKTDSLKEPWIDIGWEGTPKQLPASFPYGKGTSQVLLEYHHRDMCYVYDTANDGQRVLQKRVARTALDRHYVGYSYIEEQLPSHKFPCLNEMTQKQELHRTTYRVNNRLSYVVDYEPNADVHYCYIRYQHSANVDIDKMNGDIKRTMSVIKRTMLP
jgi:hypothetical protein